MLRIRIVSTKSHAWQHICSKLPSGRKGPGEIALEIEFHLAHSTEVILFHGIKTPAFAAADAYFNIPNRPGNNVTNSKNVPGCLGIYPIC